MSEITKEMVIEMLREIRSINAYGTKQEVDAFVSNVMIEILK